MSIPVVCSNCSARLNAPDSAAGKRVKCPKCQTAMVVPAPLPPEPGFEVVDDEPAKKPAARPKVKTDVVVDDEEGEPTTRKKRVQAAIEDDEDERPRKKKKKPAAGNSAMTRNIIGGVVLLVLLGVAGWVYYDKFGKKDDTAANPGGGQPAAPITPAGPQPGPSNPKVAAFLRIQNSWKEVTKKSTDALNQVSDGGTALNSAKQLQENAVQVQQLTKEFTALGRFTPEEAASIDSLPVGDQTTGQTYVAAEKRVVAMMRSKGELPPDAIAALDKALTSWATANLTFADTLRTLRPLNDKKP